MSAMAKKGPSSWVYEAEPRSAAYVPELEREFDGEFGLAEHIEPMEGVDLSEVELPQAEANHTIPPDIFEPENIWAGQEGEVLSLLADRLAMGARQYGALDAHDSRDKVQEAIEEALDLAVYLATELVRLRGLVR